MFSKGKLPSLGIWIGVFLAAFSAILDYPLGFVLGFVVFFISAGIGLVYFQIVKKQEKT